MVFLYIYIHIHIHINHPFLGTHILGNPQIFARESQQLMGRDSLCSSILACFSWKQWDSTSNSMEFHSLSHSDISFMAKIRRGVPESWGYPHSWLVYMGKRHENFDAFGVPPFEETPIERLFSSKSVDFARETPRSWEILPATGTAPLSRRLCDFQQLNGALNSSWSAVQKNFRHIPEYLEAERF